LETGGLGQLMSSFQLPTAEAVKAEAAVDQPMDLELELDILKVSQITMFAKENLCYFNHKVFGSRLGGIKTDAKSSLLD
jgi:hypothetical protein